MTDGQLVIDASVLAKIFLKDEEFSAIAESIVQRYVEGSVELVAPQLILYEIPSAIQAAVRQRRLSSNDARQAIVDFFALGIPTLGDADTLQPMIQSAYLRAEQLGCRMYDALYLVAGEVLGYRFVSADWKLYDLIKNQVGYAIWIADYERESATAP